ncbi:MAG: aminoglycoside phosphotransferase family protein [bacterium]|nr:aminoglycoside phosphotransferase family protein [bacterium]
MTLDVDSVTSFLLERSLIDSSAIVDGSLRLTSAAKRNRSLRVECSSGDSFLVKQPEPSNESTLLTLNREARFLAHCQADRHLTGVARLLPGLRLAVPEQQILILELLLGAKTLREHLGDRAPSDFPHRTVAGLGRALANLHRTFRSPDLNGRPQMGFLPAARPWIFSIHRPGIGALVRLTRANRQLLRIVQREPELSEGLDSLIWKVDTVIHGDMRSDNVLVTADAGSEPRLHLIDWEFVQSGDPAWDVAGVLQDFLLLWLRGMPLAPELKPGERTAAADLPWPVLQRAIDAFWRGYRESVGDNDHEALLERAIPFCAARVIQTAWELSNEAERLSSLAVLLLQASANIFADPQAAARDLFSLSPG